MNSRQLHRLHYHDYMHSSNIDCKERSRRPSMLWAHFRAPKSGNTCGTNLLCSWPYGGGIIITQHNIEVHVFIHASAFKIKRVTERKGFDFLSQTVGCQTEIQGCSLGEFIIRKSVEMYEILSCFDCVVVFRDSAHWGLLCDGDSRRKLQYYYNKSVYL